MSRFPKSAILSLTVMTALAAQAGTAHAAGGDVSGGGNSVVCFKSEATAAAVRTEGLQDRFLDDPELIESIEAYDLYEARMAAGLRGEDPVIMPATGSGDWEYVDRIQARIKPYFSYFVRQMEQNRENLKEERARRPLGLILDMDETALIDERFCVLATTAENHYSGATNYLTFDDRVLSHPKHPALSRAVLRLHELLYLTSRRLTGTTTSASTRKLVSMLVTLNRTLTLGGLSDSLYNLGFHQDSVADSDPLAQAHMSYLEIVQRAIDLDQSLTPDERERRVTEHSNAVRTFCSARLATMSYLSAELRADLEAGLNQLAEKLIRSARERSGRGFHVDAIEFKYTPRMQFLARTEADPRLRAVTIPAPEAQ